MISVAQPRLEIANSGLGQLNARRFRLTIPLGVFEVAIKTLLRIVGASINRAVVTALPPQRFLNAFDECGTFFVTQNGSCPR
jgi:hypothetical protein